jgi:hypothetical protein
MDYRTFIVTWSEAKRFNSIAETQHGYTAVKSPDEGDYPIRVTVQGKNSLVICEKTEGEYNQAKITIFGTIPDWINN